MTNLGVKGTVGSKNYELIKGATSMYLQSVDHCTSSVGVNDSTSKRN